MLARENTYPNIHKIVCVCCCQSARHKSCAKWILILIPPDHNGVLHAGTLPWKKKKELERRKRPPNESSITPFKNLSLRTHNTINTTYTHHCCSVVRRLFWRQNLSSSAIPHKPNKRRRKVDCGKSLRAFVLAAQSTCDFVFVNTYLHPHCKSKCSSTVNANISRRFRDQPSAPYLRTKESLLLSHP